MTTSAQRPIDGRRDDIIVTAARLFAENGYANTTMTQIARACGLRQSSLYYWFGQKEAILRELLALNRITMDFIATRIADTAESPAVRLLRFLVFDLNELCQAPVDITEIDALAERQPDGFREYWEDMSALHRELTALIAEGVEPRRVRFLATRSWRHSRYAPPSRASSTGSGARPRTGPAARARSSTRTLGRAEFVAEAARWLVRSLLADAAALPAIVAAAARHADIDGSAAPRAPSPRPRASAPLAGA